MTLETILTGTIIPFLGNYFLIIALIGTILSGNLFVLFLATLAGQGTFSYFQVLIVAFIGTIIAETIWFNVGKAKRLEYFLQRPHFIYNYKHLKKVLSKSTEKNTFLVFLGSKFVYGTRILTLMYAGRRKMHATDFIYYNFSSSAIWVTFLVTAGWLAGKGVTKLLDLANSIKVALTVFIFTIAIIYLIWMILSRIILEDRP